MTRQTEISRIINPLVPSTVYIKAICNDCFYNVCFNLIWQVREIEKKQKSANLDMNPRSEISAVYSCVQLNEEMLTILPYPRRGQE